MKLKRSAMRHFINVSGSGSPNWYWIGKDIDEMNVDMNGSFETKKNILDETSVTDDGYEPSIDVTPYFADPADDIYEFLEDLALGRKTGDECLAEYLEVVVKDTGASGHLAYKEDCKIEITSYGGSTEGYRIEFALHPCGNRVKGTVSITDKKPTFSAGESLG